MDTRKPLAHNLHIGDQILVGLRSDGVLINSSRDIDNPNNWDKTLTGTIIGVQNGHPVAWFEDYTGGHGGGADSENIAPQYHALPRTNQCWQIHLPDMFKKVETLKEPKAKKAPKSKAPKVKALTLKDFKAGEKVLIGRSALHRLMDNGQTLDPTLPAIEATVLHDGATVASTTFAIYLDPKYDHLDLSTHESGYAGMDPSIASQVDRARKATWFVNDPKLISKTHPTIELGDRVEICLSKETAAALEAATITDEGVEREECGHYDQFHHVELPEGVPYQLATSKKDADQTWFAGATVVGFQDGVPITYLDVEEGDLVAEHIFQEAPASCIDEHYVHNGTVDLAKPYFWRLPNPDTYVLAPAEIADPIPAKEETPMTAPKPKKPKKVKNTTRSNETLGLHLGDHIMLNVWKDHPEVSALVVGFHPDGRPVVFMGGEDLPYGSEVLDDYKEGLHQDWNHILYDVQDGVGKFWNLSPRLEDQQFSPESALGLTLGDEILLGRSKSGYLVKSDGQWDTTGKYPPLKGKVVGFKRDHNSKPLEPMVVMERAQEGPRLRSDQARWDYNHEDAVSPKYAKEYGCDSSRNMDECGFYYVSKKTVFKRLSTSTTTDTKQGVKTMEKTAFWDQMKQDAGNAGYRVAATQINKGTKAAILALLTKQGGSSEGIKAFAEMLDTVYGEGAISLLLGLATHYAPIDAMKDPRIQRIGDEFRIQALSGAGNEIMNTLTEMLMPVVLGALASIPEEKTNARVAVSSKHEEEDHIEEVLPHKTATA